jgi:glycosyltransferase involved in cell wall biosynthesis
MATLAGLEYSSGEAVIVMDVDLQDPPELIPEMVAKWREGNDVVLPQRRIQGWGALDQKAHHDMRVLGNG